MEQVFREHLMKARFVKMSGDGKTGEREMDTIVRSLHDVAFDSKNRFCYSYKEIDVKMAGENHKKT